jgi:hypothetical protein
MSGTPEAGRVGRLASQPGQRVPVISIWSTSDASTVLVVP